MTDYNKVARFSGREFHKVPEGLFGECLQSVIRAAGPLPDEKAMEIIEAVFGPLRLLSPPPDHYLPCDHAYFRFEGGWVFCAKDHSGDGPGEDDGDPECHRSADGDVDWYSDDADDRAFDPWER